jgi:PAS domain-containing protein
MSAPEAQYPIELILTRQLASQLAMPVFIVDAEGTLVFYNEAAEAILGRRFEETGAMTADEWARAFTPRHATGEPLAPEALPLMIALREERPAHADFHIRGLDAVDRSIEATAFPLISLSGRRVGAVVVFWEQPRR